MGKPSLQEIAAMPFPASLAAMRRHYDAFWNTPAEVKDWRVSLYYEVREDRSETYAITASTPEEARATALAQLKEDFGEVDLQDVQIRAVTDASEGAPLFHELVH